MFTINKTFVAGAAVLAVGFVAAIDFAQSRAPLTPAASVAARFPASSEMMKVISAEPVAQPRPATQGAAPEGCVREHWPYIADECLTASDGEKRQRPTRTVPIERRMVGESVHLASR